MADVKGSGDGSTSSIWYLGYVSGEEESFALCA